MTFSNGSFNRSPLANPFNTRLGPANFTLNPRGTARKAVQFNPDCTDLPLPQPYDPSQQEQLHVPQAQAPHMSMQSIQNIIDDYAKQKTWDDRQINQLPANGKQASALDKKSQDYWKKADEESKKLSASMSDEQKKMLADLDSGKLFPMPKLEEVDDG